MQCLQQSTPILLWGARSDSSDAGIASTELMPSFCHLPISAKSFRNDADARSDSDWITGGRALTWFNSTSTQVCMLRSAGYPVTYSGLSCPPVDSVESGTVGRVEGPLGCFAPLVREPPGHRPFALVVRAVPRNRPSSVTQLMISSMRARPTGERLDLEPAAIRCAASSPGSWRRAMTRW